MKQIFLSFFWVLSSTSMIAFAETPKLRSAEALSFSVNHKLQKFSGSLKPGFHFNDKAPNALEIDAKEIKPAKLTKQAVEFKLPKAWSQGRATLYVCDDAITYCETHSLELKGTNKQPTSDGTKIRAVNQTSNGKLGKFGFLEDDYAKALALAESQKKPILIDFSARWCPGCVRYEKEVFPQNQFAKISKNFIKLKIDVDRFQNAALSEKFAVHGIPTFIVINAKEQEISRLVDFHPMEKLEGFLQAIEKDPTSMKELMAKQNPNSNESLLIGRRLLASGNVDESIPYFEKVTSVPPELLQARIDKAKKSYKDDKSSESAKKAYAQSLRDALTKENQTTRSLAWRAELVELLDPKSEEVKNLVAEGTAIADKALGDDIFMKEALKTESLGEFVGYEKLWVAILKAELIESAGSSAEVLAKAWEDAAVIGAANKVSPKAAGPALRYLIVLVSAKKFPEAEAFADEILKNDPNNTDVKRRKMKVLIGLNKPAEAIQLGEKILPVAEGRNEFWVAESLAKAYIAANKKPEAKRLITAYLQRPELSTDMMKPSKKSLEDLLKSIQ